jgi:hypothetical protein
MAEKRGVKLQPKEKYSDKYPDLIDKGDGVFRKPYTYRGRQANRYFIETKCVCGSVVLAHLSNFKRYGSAVCSEKCRKAIVSKPDGSIRRRRGANKGSIIEKCAGHPYAKKGYVHQHRLIVERDIGRFLTPEEVVHHINCVDTDNRLDNLFVCSKKEHTDAHNSLMDCVPYLLENNVIFFDRNTGRYKVNGSPL